MNKDELTNLAGNPNFISGIHNYCDRWCERCQFASRCAVYATEKADPELDDPAVRDITNEKFWRKMHEIFQTTAELISDWAAEAGVDIQAADTEEAMAEHAREMEKADRDKLSQAAQRYATMVEDWFKRECATEENLHTDHVNGSEKEKLDIEIPEAVEVVRWYQFFIAAKVFRAVIGTDRFDEEDFDDDDALTFDFVSDETDDNDLDYDLIIARSSRIDSNGSAKIALVAIDRSIAAWRSLQVSLAKKSDTIKPLLLQLDRLRQSLEARFPRARDFVRPGFDELMTEFVS
jgi:hypothetical protein